MSKHLPLYRGGTRARVTSVSRSTTDARKKRVGSILVIPPFLKVVSEPLLGPAMLAGAAHVAGHETQVLDLNARWLDEQLPANTPIPASGFVGDHDRPGQLLRHCQQLFTSQWLRPSEEMTADRVQDLLTIRLAHDEVLAVARNLSYARLGRWIRRRLSAATHPAVVGVSVMYAGQVLAALVTSLVARSLWPDALIVWGGAHVTALCEEIAADSRYGALIHRFVFGYAEQTWVNILDAVRSGAPLPNAAVRAGSGTTTRARDDGSVVPLFDVGAACRRGRLTLSAQTSRGCAYGKCTFCTYPFVEGRYRELPLECLRTVVDLAVECDAAISLKDSLVVPPRLRDIGAAIAGRVPWSACTKLNEMLNEPFLRELAASGCSTLEIGLETLSPKGQDLIAKPQSQQLFYRVLDAAADAGIALVVNYMTGLPRLDRNDEQSRLRQVQEAIASRPKLAAKVEHNEFQLERRAPMAERPQESLHITGEWPWSSVLQWTPLR